VYEYAKGARPELRQNVDEELTRRERLTVAQTYSVYSRYLVEPAEQALMSARTNLLELVEQVKHAVHEAKPGHGRVRHAPGRFPPATLDGDHDPRT